VQDRYGWTPSCSAVIGAEKHGHLHPYRLPSALQTELEALIGRPHAVVVALASLRQSFMALTARPSQLQPHYRH